MLTAASAARLGMKAILVLKKRGVLTAGNVILDHIFGADVRFVDTDSYRDVYAEMERIMEGLRQEGHTPYFIPVGGSVALGCLGYVNCIQEIAHQGTRSIGIGVCADPFEKISLRLMQETAALLDCEVPVGEEDIHIHYQIGPGYAQSSPEGREAVYRLARSEGILVDPVYTGKALAGLFALMEQGYFNGMENILFLHTGGAGALFAVDL